MSEATSDTVTVTAPLLLGVWVHDPTDPEATELQFLYTEGRDEQLEVAEAELEFVGRRYPVVEYGEAEGLGVNVTIAVPFGPEHDAEVEWWRAAKRARRAIVYRDNRGRIMHAAIRGQVKVTDTRGGTALALTLRAVSYDEAVA